MILQELLFPNYDTCARYEMYFRFVEAGLDEVYDDLDNKKFDVRYKRHSHPRAYYDPKERAIHVADWQRLDFDTYFNSFAVAKWNKYTRLDNLTLRLELKGTFHVSLMHMYFTNQAAPYENIFHEQVCRCDERTSFEFTIPCHNWDRGMVCFRLYSLEGEDNVCYGGCYVTDVDEAALNPVNIAIDICTFRRESFVERNIDLMNRGIIENPDHPLYGHLDVFISDNGRTLDVERLSSDRVHIFPNKNVGGAGGFSRGMIEILDMSERRPFSHVLVMDDDVLINTDALLRNYRLLQFMKPEYAGKTVAGAMLRLDDRFMQHECGGYWDGFWVLNGKSSLNLTVLKDMLRNENEGAPNYNAWWYSCIPISKISNQNLPLPIFIRYDDVEYGLRTGSDIIEMSGICLWHEPFEYKYSSSMEYYQIRNALIVNALHKPEFDASKALILMKQMVKVNIGRYRYTNCELVFRGVEDFLKGPEFLLNTDAEALHKDILASGEKYKPLNQLEVIFDEGTYLKSMRRERVYKKIIRYITINRHLLRRKEATVVDVALNGAKDFAGQKKVLNYDVGGNRGFVTAYNRKRLFQTMARSRKLQKELKARHAEVCEAYRQAMPRLTSREFWNEYLDLK